MTVNPLMTVWLISCAINYSGLTGADKYSSYIHEKNTHGASELARLFDKGDSIASYKLNALRLLAVEKKKKNKSSDTKTTTEFDPCEVSSSTTAKHKKSTKTTTEAANNKVEPECSYTTEDPCATSSSTTAKSKKGTKKTKTPSTTSSQGGDGSDINIINASGGNKWKKIQKFFFGPPNWSFNKSYRVYGPTTSEAKYKELKPMQLPQHSKEYNHDQTTIRVSTYLHPIPNNTNSECKDKLFVKEENIQKNTTGMENNYSTGQINDVDTSNNTSKQQPNEIEKIPPHKFYEGGMVSKEPISQEVKSIIRNQENGDDRISSLGLMDKTDGITSSMQVDQQEALLSIPWHLKQDGSTREKLSESDKMSSIGGEKPLTQELPSEPEKQSTGTQQIDHTSGVIYSNAYIPSNNHIEPLEKIYYNTKGTLYTDPFETANTIGINEDIDERQLQLKPEEITDNIKEKYEVSIVREDPKLSFKPEATIDLERPPNQTSMEKPDSSYKHNSGMTADKWKHIFNFKEPDYEQFKNLYNSIIKHRVSNNDLISSKIENTLNQMIKPNINNIYSIGYENNMTDDTNMFLKTFGTFLRKSNPEIFPYLTAEKLYKTSLRPIYDVDKDNAYDQKAKQYFFVNTETKLPAENINNNPTVIQIDEDKYLSLTSETTLFRKSITDYLNLIEPKVLLKDESEKKPIESNTTTPSSTIMKQYSIDIWPKYTEKIEYNVDYFNNIITQSSVKPSTSTLLLEVSSAYNHQNELSSTRAAGSSSTETTKANEYTGTLKLIETDKFETVVTNPLIFTDINSEIKDPLPANEVTTTKLLSYESVLNITLNPMLFGNIWGFLNHSSYKPISSTLNIFTDDQIAFDNQHEFNADHHFQSTSRPLFSIATASEWAPFNIPVLENELDIISPSTLKVNEVTLENIKPIKKFKNINKLVTEMLKKKEMSMIEKNKKTNFTLVPNYVPYSDEIDRRNLFLFNHPLAKPKSLKKIQKYTGHQNELLSNPTWSEIMYQTRLRKPKIGYPIEDFRLPEKLIDGNVINQNFRKPSFFEEKIREDNQINFPEFSKGKVTNNGRDDVTELLMGPFLRNLKNMELLPSKSDSRNFDKNEVIKNNLDKIATEVMSVDEKMKNKLKFWKNFNGPSSLETEEVKEITNKYEQTIADVDDEFNQNTVGWSLLEFQRKNVSKLNENKFDLQPIHNNEMLTKQPCLNLPSEKKAISPSNSWNVRNEQNEKLLASEKSLDRILSISSPSSVNFLNETNSSPLTNNIDLMKNINQSLPEITNNSDINKNEFSAIQMSAIKIIKKKPDMFVPSLFDPFKNILDQTSNNTGINCEMSQMFMKMQDFANKFGMKKILLKRGVTDSQNSNYSWRNKCSTHSSWKTGTIPFGASLTGSNIKISPLTFNRNKKWCNVMSNIGHNKISKNEWKYNIQSVIDEQNEKRNSNAYKNNISKDSESSLKLKPLGKMSGNLIHQRLLNSDVNYENNDEQFFTNYSKKGLKRNVLGNKKMKSRELEFILDRNLPRLPLNKRQFIAYMMTGLKNSGDHIALDDEKHSQLSKANLQNLIDRNVKKEKVVGLINKRPRKKQWNTDTFP